VARTGPAAPAAVPRLASTVLLTSLELRDTKGSAKGLAAIAPAAWTDRLSDACWACCTSVAAANAALKLSMYACVLAALDWESPSAMHTVFPRLHEAVVGTALDHQGYWRTV
jgi:hypothetical protein